ncbi:MAG: DUF2007 domain-containing protein [Hyphomicrobiaceae bacterium]
MRELIRTNDAVLVSLIEAVLSEAGLVSFVADGHMSVLEGSLGILPRRVLVADDEWDEARRLVVEAGVEQALLSP